jgi:hypothetical protein
VKPDVPDRAVQMLALLQRDGRLIDFLEKEDGYFETFRTPAERALSNVACVGIEQHS